MTAGRKSTFNKTDWNTPQKYVNAILEVFKTIDLDPCSNDESIVPAATKYILPDKDGLRNTWDFKKIYVNPPYGRSKDGTTIWNWLEKCWISALLGNQIIALIPVATNTKHWKEFVFRAKVICFLEDTRLKFRINNSENNKGISVACAMIYWGNNPDKFVKIFKKYGNCVENYR